MMKNKLEKIVDLMERDDSTDAPADSVKWAKNLFIQHAAASEPSMIRRLIATLQASLSPETGLAGERSAGPAAERQMLFTVDDIGVHINVAEAKNTVSIRGQMLSESFAIGTARLNGEIGTITQPITDPGEFRFERVPKGAYSLTLRAGDTEVVIESLEL
jgi:hypothetical protein